MKNTPSKRSECMCPPPKPYDWKHLEGCPVIGHTEPKGEEGCPVLGCDEKLVHFHEAPSPESEGINFAGMKVVEDKTMPPGDWEMRDGVIRSHTPAEKEGWESKAERADYFEPDALVLPVSVVSLLLSAQREELKKKVEALREKNRNSDDYKMGEHWSTHGFPRAIDAVLEEIRRDK